MEQLTFDREMAGNLWSVTLDDFSPLDTGR